MNGSNFRPLSFGEVLDGAFTLYRRNFRLFIGTSFLLMVGVSIGASVVGGVGAFMMTIMPGFMAFLIGLLIAVAIGGMVTMLWSTLTWQAAQSYAGKPVSLPDGVAAAVGAAMTLVGAATLASIGFVIAMVGVWLVALLVMYAVAAVGVDWITVLAGLAVFLGGCAAFFWVGALFFGILPAVMVEEKGPIDAIARSVELARGAVPRIAGILFVTFVIVWLPSLAIAALSGGLQQAFNPDMAQAAAAVSPLSIVVQQLLAWTVIVLTMPFLPAVLVMLYYDRRVRTEALDVRILTEQLGLAGA
jgi:hypothetical protein